MHRDGRDCDERGKGGGMSRALPWGGPCDGARAARPLRRDRGVGEERKGDAERGVFLRPLFRRLERAAARTVLRRHQKGQPQRQGPHAHAAGKRFARRGLRVRHRARRLPPRRDGGQV